MSEDFDRSFSQPQPQPQPQQQQQQQNCYPPGNQHLAGKNFLSFRSLQPKLQMWKILDQKTPYPPWN